MIKELETFIPSNLVVYVRSLVENETIDFKLVNQRFTKHGDCLLYTSPSPRDRQKSRMPSSA